MHLYSKPRLEVCLSPALLHLFEVKDVVVVIIDIFRATSTIAAALDNGASYVLPVSSVAECIELGTIIDNSVTAGERDGKIVEGLKHGNSPLEYPTSFIQNRPLILTTTNGTKLLNMVDGAAEIIAGSFLNLDAVCNYLLKIGKNVLLGCAAWKDRYNLEDTLFAGAVVNKIGHAFNINCDSARAANHLYETSVRGGFLGVLKDSSHYRRLASFGLEKDMEYCTTPNLHPIVPILKNGKLIVYE